MFPFPFAGLFALSSAALAIFALNQLSKIKTSLALVLSGLFLFCSLVIYQPSSCFFWVALAPSLLKTQSQLNQKLHEFLKFFLFFSAVVLIYYILYQSGTWPFLEAPSLRGTDLVSDLTSRTWQFFIWPIADVPQSVYNWTLLATSNMLAIPYPFRLGLPPASREKTGLYTART